jgi:Winged helix-turn helix
MAALVEREFKVHYHPRYLARPLKAHHVRVQRPTTRTKERDELAIVVWPKREGTALKRRRIGSSGRFFPGTRRITASAPD